MKILRLVYSKLQKITFILRLIEYQNTQRRQFQLIISEMILPFLTITKTFKISLLVTNLV